MEDQGCTISNNGYGLELATTATVTAVVGWSMFTHSSVALLPPGLGSASRPSASPPTSILMSAQHDVEAWLLPYLEEHLPANLQVAETSNRRAIPNMSMQNRPPIGNASTLPAGEVPKAPATTKRSRSAECSKAKTCIVAGRHPEFKVFVNTLLEPQRA